MADSGGHWANLAEAQKLTEPMFLPGVVQEDIRSGGLLGVLPVQQVIGQKVRWNRQATQPSAHRASIGSQLAWEEETSYTQLDRELVIAYKQTALDQFVEGTYNNYNDYGAQQLIEDVDAMVNHINDDIIYGDSTNGLSNEPFGLHIMAQTYGEGLGRESDEINIAEGGGLALSNLRALEVGMKHGIDFFLFPQEIAVRLDAYTQEAGLSTNTFGQISFTSDDLGKRVTHWNGIPVIRSDYLVAETNGTGAGSNKRTKNTTGSSLNYSVFAIKMGSGQGNSNGLRLGFGTGPRNDMAQGQLMKRRVFADLEDFDASGLRHVAYWNLIDGSAMSVGRIYDITDVIVVA